MYNCIIDFQLRYFYLFSDINKHEKIRNTDYKKTITKDKWRGDGYIMYVKVREENQN